MDSNLFQTRFEEVIVAFKHGDDSFDSLMDAMTQNCSDEQWVHLLQGLEDQRKIMKSLAKYAEEKVSQRSVFRQKPEQPIPGVVWLAFCPDDPYEHTQVPPWFGLIDVCETRAGAVAAVDADAALRMPTRRAPNWRDHWQQSESHCPCPIPACEHVQWTRQLKSRVIYTIQNCSTADYKLKDVSDGN